MNNTEPQDIASLLGQATPSEWSVEKLAAILRFASKNTGPWDDTDFGKTFPREANAQLIVLAVNALPKMLKLREAARSVEIWKDPEQLLQAIKKLKTVLSEVDTALGLSSEPSSTPVDTSRKQKSSCLLDEKTKEAIERLRNAAATGPQLLCRRSDILTVCNFAEEKE